MCPTSMMSSRRTAPFPDPRASPTCPSVSIRRRRPSETARGAMLYIHGGGFMFGSYRHDGQRVPAVRLRTECRVRVGGVPVGAGRSVPGWARGLLCRAGVDRGQRCRAGHRPGPHRGWRRVGWWGFGCCHSVVGSRPWWPGDLLPVPADPRAGRPLEHRVDDPVCRHATVESAQRRVELEALSGRPSRRRCALHRGTVTVRRPGRTAARVCVHHGVRPAARRGHHLCASHVGGWCKRRAAFVPGHVPRLVIDTHRRVGPRECRRLGCHASLDRQLAH
ncbi:hypothetical protein GQR58_030501 [Nymphon striatum]|nr:hypothetical protein GQR58_030501 [Nymphon striatum]